MCQSAPHSFQFSAFGNSQRAAYNLAQHHHDWQRLMLIAGKNSALIDIMRQNRRQTELFWSKIGGRASTCRHFLRIGFFIIPIISNACNVFRPFYAKFRLRLCLLQSDLRCVDPREHHDHDNQNFILYAGLAALMDATRMHHFGTTLHLPDASLAIFLITGFFIASPAVFAALYLRRSSSTISPSHSLA